MYMQAIAASLRTISACSWVSCAHNLKEESAILDESYTLHWNSDLEEQTIAFAVNVCTTGWVGFGLSPNGQIDASV